MNSGPGLSVGHIHCFSVSGLISASASEGSWLLCMRWRGGVGEFCCCLCQSVCTLVSSNANMCWHPLEHYSVVVWQSTQAVVYLLGAKVSEAICERLKSRQGVREHYNILLVAVFLNQVFCCSFQRVKFCSVVGVQVTSWDRKGGDGSIWVTDVGTTTSIPSSILCRAICEDLGPGALGMAILHNLQCECSLQLWSLCSLAARPRISVLTSGRLFRDAQTLVSSSHFPGSASRRSAFSFCKSFNLCLKLFLFRLFFCSLNPCWSFGGVDDCSVSSAFSLVWQLCTGVCIPKVEGLCKSHWPLLFNDIITLVVARGQKVSRKQNLVWFILFQRSKVILIRFESILKH